MSHVRERVRLDLIGSAFGGGVLRRLGVGRSTGAGGYVVDTSFFPSIGAVNPALTAMANAIRVGDHLTERLS